MDRFLQLHGEEALARLMLKSKRLRVSGVKRTIGIPDNRKGKKTASVVDNIGRIKEKFADRIFCKSDLMSELGFTTGQGAYLINRLKADEVIHRVPKLFMEKEFRYRFAEA